MANGKHFFESPILNSPYECPTQHWELDEDGQPTNKIERSRRSFSFITAIPKSRKSKKSQTELDFGSIDERLDSENDQYELAQLINSIRDNVGHWRGLAESHWGVTPETARLLRHWRHHNFSQFRPFFCQVEAAETVIWLTEVAGSRGGLGKGSLAHLERVNELANPELSRLALKLATGAGKDHCHGNVNRVANHQRCPTTEEPSVYARIPCGYPRDYNQGPASRPPAQRPRQLLSKPRVGSD